MSHKNHMNLIGKDVGNPDKLLTINLADDSKEVRGFGQPVTRSKAIEMADAFFKSCEAAMKIVKEIETKPAYSDLKFMPEFGQLKSLVKKLTLNHKLYRACSVKK